MPNHALQLFDTPETLAARVCQFVRDGVQCGDLVMLVPTRAHADAIRHAGTHHDVDVDALLQTGHLVMHDAEDTVQRLMHGGEINWPRFDALIGTWTRFVNAQGRRVRVYGEAVDVLARAYDFANAIRLEECWNRLEAAQGITVLCSYLAEHFGNPRDAESLRSICALHSHVHCDPHDVLGAYLLKTRAGLPA